MMVAEFVLLVVHGVGGLGKALLRNGLCGAVADYALDRRTDVKFATAWYDFNIYCLLA